jgi:hypothetical protein
MFYFESDSLVYWGSFDDFKVHESHKLRAVGIEALKTLMGDA